MPDSLFIQLGSEAHDIFAIAQIAAIYPEVHRITDAHRKAIPRLSAHGMSDVVYSICVKLIGGGGRQYVYNSKENRDAALRKISETLAPTLVIEPLLAIDILEPSAS